MKTKRITRIKKHKKTKKTYQYGGADDDKGAALIPKTMNKDFIELFYAIIGHKITIDKSVIYEKIYIFLKEFYKYIKQNKVNILYINNIDEIKELYYNFFKQNVISNLKEQSAEVFLNNIDNYAPMIIDSLNLTYDLIIKKLHKIINYFNAPGTYFCYMRLHIYDLFLGISDCIMIFNSLRLLLLISNVKDNDLLKRPKLFYKLQNDSFFKNLFGRERKSFDTYVIHLYLKLNDLLTYERQIYELFNDKGIKIIDKTMTTYDDANFVNEEFDKAFPNKANKELSDRCFFKINLIKNITTYIHHIRNSLDELLFIIKNQENVKYAKCKKLHLSDDCFEINSEDAINPHLINDITSNENNENNDGMRAPLI